METAAIEEMFRLEDHHWWFVGKRLLLARPGGVRLSGFEKPGNQVQDGALAAAGGADDADELPAVRRVLDCDVQF